MTQKASKKKPFGKRIKDINDTNEDLYNLVRRKAQTPVSAISVGVGSFAPETPLQSTGFLKTEGDTMIGPIAVFPAVQSISLGTVDLMKNGGSYTSRLIVASEAPGADDLDTILNATFAGQFLVLQTVAGDTVTLKHLTGNIRLATGADIVVGPQQNILLIFDSIANQWTNVSPVASTSGGAGAFATISLNNVAGTAVSASLIPGTTNLIDLGEDATPLRWRNYYGHQFDVFDFGEFTERVGDPATTANKVQLYAKDKAGTSALFFQDDAGTVFDLTVGAGGGANTALSNLVNPTAINQDLQPDLAGDGIRDLGDFSFFWDNTFTRRVSFRDDKGIVNSETSIGSNPTSLWLNQTILTNDIGLYWDGVQRVSFDPNLGRVSFLDPINELRMDGGSARTLSMIVPGLAGDVLFTLLGGVASQGFKFAQFVEFGLAGGIIINPGGDADFQANNIVDINNITTASNGDLLGFRDVQGDAFRYVNDPTVVFLDPSASGWDINMAGTGDVLAVKFGGVPGLAVSENAVTVATNWFTVLNDELSITHATRAYIDQGDIPVPTSPAVGRSRVFLDSADNILKVLHNTGGAISLEAGGGGQNQSPWLTNIDANALDLFNIKDIKGRDTGASGSFKIIFDANEDSDTYIRDDVVNDTVAFVSNNLVMWFLENRTELSETFGLSMVNGSIDMLQNIIQFTETTDPATPATNKGRVFLRSSDGALSIRKDDGSVISLEQGGAGGGADTNLGNLTPTTINESLIPQAGKDLGSAGLQWRDLWLTGIAHIDQLTVDIGPNFINGGLSVSNLLQASNNFAVLGDTQLGNSTSDDVFYFARVSSNIIPTVAGRDLGDVSRQWDLFVRNLTASGAGNWDLNGTDIDDVGDIEIDGDLNHDGSRVGFFGKFPQTRKNVFFPVGPTGNNNNDILFLYGAVNALISALGDQASGYGLVNN